MSTEFLIVDINLQEEKNENYFVRISLGPFHGSLKVKSKGVQRRILLIRSSVTFFNGNCIALSNQVEIYLWANERDDGLFLSIMFIGVLVIVNFYHLLQFSLTTDTILHTKRLTIKRTPIGGG